MGLDTNVQEIVPKHDGIIRIGCGEVQRGKDSPVPATPTVAMPTVSVGEILNGSDPVRDGGFEFLQLGWAAAAVLQRHRPCAVLVHPADYECVIIVDGQVIGRVHSGSRGVRWPFVDTVLQHIIRRIGTVATCSLAVLPIRVATEASSLLSPKVREACACGGAKRQRQSAPWDGV